MRDSYEGLDSYRADRKTRTEELLLEEDFQGGIQLDLWNYMRSVLRRNMHFTFRHFTLFVGYGSMDLEKLYCDFSDEYCSCVLSFQIKIQFTGDVLSSKSINIWEKVQIVGTAKLMQESHALNIFVELQARGIARPHGDRVLYCLQRIF